MIAPDPIVFRRRRSAPKPQRRPAPAVVNQITSVAYGPAPESLTVTVSGTLVDVADVTKEVFMARSLEKLFCDMNKWLWKKERSSSSVTLTENIKQCPDKFLGLRKVV